MLQLCPESCASIEVMTQLGQWGRCFLLKTFMRNVRAVLEAEGKAVPMALIEHFCQWQSVRRTTFLVGLPIFHFLDHSPLHYCPPPPPPPSFPYKSLFHPTDPIPPLITIPFSFFQLDSCLLRSTPFPYSLQPVSSSCPPFTLAFLLLAHYLTAESQRPHHS